MEIAIKYLAAENEISQNWYCKKCGLQFTLGGPCNCYITPNYCPNCGTVRIKNPPLKYECKEHICLNCLHYDGSHCVRELNNLDDSLKNERMLRNPEDTCIHWEEGL